MLGIPTEIYVYGMQYVYICFAVASVSYVFQKVYLPVFHNMQLTSSYEVMIIKKKCHPNSNRNLFSVFRKKIQQVQSYICVVSLLNWRGKLTKRKFQTNF